MVGLGKLGLPVALAIESRGHEVCGYDINPDSRMFLCDRKIPYREEGLQPLLDSHSVKWCNSIKDVVAQSDLVFVPIQTPHEPQYDGSRQLPDTRADFDYSHLKRGLAAVAKACEELKKPTIVAVISTCLPGTFTERLRPVLNEYVSYVYTPQFIAMGTVLQDYLYPEFNLIGVEDEWAADQLELFYKSINESPVLRTDITTAEGIKLAYNSIITAKTVIANAWGELSERLGMNFDDIKKSWDLSTKRLLSANYFNAGMSDGGGCHPRDNIAMSYVARRCGMSYDLWESLMQARESYENWHAQTAAYASTATGLPLVLLGRAFKPETDIETGSPALLVADCLRSLGVEFEHVNEATYEPAVFFIATQNVRYAYHVFPAGSIVLDPFGYIPDQAGVEVMRLGRRTS